MAVCVYIVCLSYVLLLYFIIIIPDYDNDFILTVLNAAQINRKLFNYYSFVFIRFSCLSNCASRVVATRIFRLGASIKCNNCDDLAKLWQGYKITNGIRRMLTDFGDFVTTGGL